MIRKTPLLYEDKPLFGLDIGHNQARVLQLERVKSDYKVIGYGETPFDPTAIEDGVITKPEIIAAAIQELFRHRIIGHISTARVAVSLPIAHAFTRSLQVPAMSQKELDEAVETEAEQYLPSHQDLYVDYTVNIGQSEQSTVFIVGMPKKIVDSYLTLTDLLGFEAIMMQTSTGASAHLFTHDSQSDAPSLLIDMGSNSADITVFDGGPVISGTVACGGEELTSLIAGSLGVTTKEANLIKAKYGLSMSKKQQQIEAAMNGPLSLLVKEIKRNIRYFEEHAGGAQRTIAQIIMMGGGANMPGLSDYLTSALRTPVRTFDPVAHINFGHLQPFNTDNRMSFVTVAGLGIISPQEVFA